jgi:bifunctional DNA-binding transcriptional regulator/antitoxin component of YhaV-PrlF toxin-antitoxin module
MRLLGRPLGPRTITQVYQVSVPKKLLDRVDLKKHDEVYFAVSAEDPSIICMFSGKKATLTPAGDDEMQAVVT